MWSTFCDIECTCLYCWLMSTDGTETDEHCSLVVDCEKSAD